MLQRSSLALTALFSVTGTGCGGERAEFACAGCGIQLQHVVTLGSEDGPGAMASIPAAVSRDSRGRFCVGTPEQGPEAPFVYRPDGRFLQRLGREGEGPGEYRSPNAILVTPGDTLHIFDGSTARLTVLSPEYDVVRTAPGVTVAYHAVRLPNRQYVFNSEGGGYPLVLLDALGSTLRRFGSTHEIFSRDRSWRNARAIAVDPSGNVWTASRFFEYAIQLWNPDGRLLMTVVPKSSWYPSYDTLSNPTPDVPPMPTVWGIWESEGKLWILGSAADDHWVEALGEPRRLEGQLVYPLVDRRLAYDGIIDVLDPVDGTSVASRRLPDVGWPMWVVEDGLIAIARESAVGWWFVDIYQVSLADDQEGQDAP